MCMTSFLLSMKCVLFSILIVCIASYGANYLLVHKVLDMCCFSSDRASVWYVLLFFVLFSIAYVLVFLSVIVCSYVCPLCHFFFFFQNQPLLYNRWIPHFSSWPCNPQLHYFFPFFLVNSSKENMVCVILFQPHKFRETLGH